jgi:hypothetical protein
MDGALKGGSGISSFNTLRCMVSGTQQIKQCGTRFLNFTTPDLDARISRFTVGMWNGTTVHTLGDPPVFGSVAKQQADPALLWYLYGEQLEGTAMVRNHANRDASPHSL